MVRTMLSEQLAVNAWARPRHSLEFDFGSLSLQES
jgi:hypothetical protein